MLTKRGRNFISSDLISNTQTNVWAANNQKLDLLGEATLTLELEQPIQHKFLIAQHDISGCHALLGTDLLPKLNSFFLAGIRNHGASLCMNGTTFPLGDNHKPDNSYIILLDSHQEIGEETFFITSTPAETSNKLLDEDID